jgi:hypothetical protein
LVFFNFSTSLAEVICSSQQDTRAETLRCSMTKFVDAIGLTIGDVRYRMGRLT